MSTIYKMFRGRATEAWHQLTSEEQDALMEKVTAARVAVDGDVVIGCNSQWASERWTFFGVEEFPDIAAVQKHTQLLEEINWLRYIDTETVLGTKWES